jgi:hypothetical protein
MKTTKKFGTPPGKSIFGVCKGSFPEISKRQEI